MCVFVYVSLYKALSSEEAIERRKASACLSRIGRAVTSVQANEKEREADSLRVKAAARPLLGFQPEAGGGGADEFAKGDGPDCLGCFTVVDIKYDLLYVSCHASDSGRNVLWRYQ